MNALCEATCLEYTERRRNDETFLNEIKVDSILDPTTAGDFCRRFRSTPVRQLLDAINRARLKVWKRQPDEFFEEVFVDMDGTLTVTIGECKEGMDGSYRGIGIISLLKNVGQVFNLPEIFGIRAG